MPLCLMASLYNGKASFGREALSYATARLVMLMRVLGWSGPRCAFNSHTFSWRATASDTRPTASKDAASMFMLASVSAS